ncbi:oxidoreductase [Verticiella sediminum]|uniref:Oxidoreductase n=1 Tax=Verticiella sediminum TaxID=1247510 RepID=A0A556ANQ7_9BURK|nr:PDR/VanB family oxidoreductase [Verticiella sediminum]TSH94517.1 oxidoreductase [Verticiella sediminum]
MAATDSLNVVVSRIAREAETIISLELRPSSAGALLPAFSAGAHVDLCLPGGMSRSYSLINPCHERDRYVIAVHREPSGRGGSAYVHDQVRTGDSLAVRPPRNLFPLVESAGHSVLIAGGIGITPLWCMIQRLHAIGSPWTLHYASRTPAHAAFLAAIRTVAATGGQRLHAVFDGAPGAARLDIAQAVDSAPAGSHFYCCGPAPMIEAFQAATRTLPPERVHLESFGGAQRADAGGYTVELARSGRSVVVPPGKTILDTLLDQGIAANYSCQEGVCGLCEVPVLAGEPDHRDHVLSDEEKAAQNVMMICCSGAKSTKLVLDL